MPSCPAFTKVLVSNQILILANKHYTKLPKKTHHSLLGLFFINYFEVAICLVIWTKQSNGLRYGLIYLCKVFLLSSIGCTLATRLGGTRTFSGQLDVGARILIQRTYITRDSYLMKGF